MLKCSIHDDDDEKFVREREKKMSGVSCTRCSLASSVTDLVSLKTVEFVNICLL